MANRNYPAPDLQAISKYVKLPAKKLCNDFFRTETVVSGAQMADFMPIKQVNLFMLRNLYDKWAREAQRMRSPYFDYESQEVNDALQEFMNTLSRHISVKREHFEDLLTEALQSAVLLALSPIDYFTHEIETLAKPKVQLAPLRELSRFLVINRSLADSVLDEMDLQGNKEMFAGELLRYFSTANVETAADRYDAQIIIDELNRISPIRLTDLCRQEPEAGKPVEQAPVKRDFFSEISGIDAPLKADVIFAAESGHTAEGNAKTEWLNTDSRQDLQAETAPSAFSESWTDNTTDNTSEIEAAAPAEDNEDPFFVSEYNKLPEDAPDELNTWIADSTESSFDAAQNTDPGNTSLDEFSAATYSEKETDAGTGAEAGYEDSLPGEGSTDSEGSESSQAIIPAQGPVEEEEIAARNAPLPWKENPPPPLEVAENKANTNKGGLFSRILGRKKGDEPKSASILNDSIKQDGLALNDAAQHLRIESLQNEIPLNDRFLYIRELFNSDRAAWDFALRQLDNAADRRQAMDSLMPGYARRFNWDMSPGSTASKFTDLVERKFSAK